METFLDQCNIIKDICMMTSSDYNYQNAFHCNLCKCRFVSRMSDSSCKKLTTNSLPQGIVVAVVKMSSCKCTYC